MKALTFINKHWKNFLVVVLLLFIFLTLKQCRSEQSRHQALATAARNLEQKVKRDSAERALERMQFEDYKKDAEGKRQLAEAEKGEADKKVKDQQRTIDRLSGIVRNSVWATNSTDPFAVVSPQYKAACDSLPAEIDKMTAALADKDTAINGMLDLYNYEIQIRDEEIYKEMQYSDSLRQDFNRQTALLKSALKQGKPRGKLLGGISVLGNQTNFLSGAGVVLAYQSKGGKQYQLSPKFIKTPLGQAELYYEGTVLFTLFR